ncbi:peptidase S9 [Marinicella pacifica]|uniref:Peptidase S9 n=1 Tax=Marinicella pacifica TaxID=1171543 RepID=A0A917CUV5_9GAMM|nr:S9 family peptidase [Marinicella pacifica]GGF97506.1 peptidase S9 [Marinicella pacifica]
MHKHILLLSLGLSLLLSGCQQPAEKPTAAADNFKTYSAEEFFQTTSVFGSSINHDQTAVLVSSDESGIFNAYKVALDGSGKEALTHSTDESIYVNSWFPNDDRILYNADQGGNELDHVYVREEDGRVTDLTPGEGLKASFAGWHEDDQQFYINSNERNPKFFDLYRYQVDDYTREMVYQNDSGYQLGDISPDGRWLALSKTNSNADSDIYLVDLNDSDAEPQLIAGDAPEDVAHGIYTFTPDSQQLIYGSNANSEFNQAMAYDLADASHNVSYTADWDVSFTYFSEDGQYRVTGINQDAQTVLDIVNTETGEALNIPNLPAGDLRGVNFSDDSSTLVFYLNSDTSPSNLYTYTPGDNSATRLTSTGNPDINEDHLVAGEVRRFESFDGLEIPGILYKPKQAAYEQVPALVFIHGGPGGQSRFGYSALTQHLVNNGYAIFKINNRGSSGYGKTFFHLDDKKHGDHDLKDVVYNKKYLQSLDWVDADKIGVMGGSYGGYLTMAAMAFTDEFDVGINIFGVTNWVRTLKSIPPYWEAFKKSLYDELGDPETDGERLYNISPVFFGHQVKNPVLVVQGANDPRVLQVESDEMVEAIRSAGTHVEYLLFDDEGHGFSKKENRIQASQKYLEFLDKFLR